MYLESPMTTEKAMALKKLGLSLLVTRLPGSLSEWKVIGFDVEPAETITEYPLILHLTLAHDDYSDLGELEELIEDRDSIINWLDTLGVSFTEVEVDINADRYRTESDIPEDDFTHDYTDGDEL